MPRTTPCLRIAVVALLVLSGRAPADDAASDTVVRDAGYAFSYFGKNLGDESFTITRVQNGYRIDAKLALDIDGQIPSTATYELDADRRLVRATYRELKTNGAHAEYVIEDGVLIARGLGGSARGERRITLENGAIVTGPHYVTDFFVLEPLDLAVGARHEQVAYTFGFDGWEPTRVTLKSKRESDKRVAGKTGPRVNTTVYRCEIVTDRKTFKTRSFLDADGVSVRIKVSAPIGSLNVTLAESRE